MTNDLSPGAVIAGSILFGRTLSPVDQITGHWPLVQGGWQSWRRLGALLDRQPPTRRMRLPQPDARLDVSNVSVRASDSGAILLRDISFSVAPGQALGIIGPTGSGNSTLAKLIAGAVTPTVGTVRLGRAAMTQYARSDLRRYIGYLPQRPQLFDGTIAANIAGFSEAQDDAAIVQAARRADAHEMILALPEGYETRLNGPTCLLSFGLIQRIALARAFFGDPMLLVLDEPDAHLDPQGCAAINAAIRSHQKAGGAVVVTAHRASTLHRCETVLSLRNGSLRALGPKDSLLSESLGNGQGGLRDEQACGPG